MRWTTRPVANEQKYRVTMSGDLSEDLLGLKIPGPTITLMVRTQIARDAHGFDESLTAYNDLDFLIRVSQLCEIAALPEVVAVQHVGHGHGRMNIDSESVLVEKVDYIRRHMRRYSTRLSGSPPPGRACTSILRETRCSSATHAQDCPHSAWP